MKGENLRSRQGNIGKRIGTCLQEAESHNCTLELFKPMARWSPSGAQLTLVTGPTSSPTVTNSEVEPFEASHKYTVFSRAMARTFLLPQSSKLR
jgi:hypothetical protein